MLPPLTGDVTVAFVIVAVLIFVVIPLRFVKVAFVTKQHGVTNRIGMALTSVFLRGFLALVLFIMLTFNPIFQRRQIVQVAYQQKPMVGKQAIERNTVNIIRGVTTQGVNLLYGIHEIEQSFEYDDPRDKERVEALKGQLISTIAVYTEVASTNLHFNKEEDHTLKQPLLEYTELLRLPAPDVKMIQHDVGAVMHRIQQTAMKSFTRPTDVITYQQKDKRLQIRQKKIKPDQVQLAKNVHTIEAQTKYILGQFSDVADELAKIKFRKAPVRIQAQRKPQDKGLLQKHVIDKLASQSFKDMFYTGIQVLRKHLASLKEIPNIPKGMPTMVGGVLRDGLRLSKAQFENLIHETTKHVNQMGNTVVTILNKAESYTEQALEHAILVLVTTYGLDEVVAYSYYVLMVNLYGPQR